MEEDKNESHFSKVSSNNKVKIKVTKKVYEPKPNHILKKRLPHILPKRQVDFYVSQKTSFKAQLNKCEKLLDADEPEIFIHGLGASIIKACNLALQLKKNHNGTVDLEVTTTTVDLVDDFIPDSEDADFEVNSRKNSAIHIRVFRIAKINALRYTK